MTAVTYTAKRSLAVGHVVDQSYTMRIRFASLEPNPNVRKSERSALSGKTESLLFHRKRQWRATTAILMAGELELAREFLDSVINGETFQFDEFGTEVPDLPITAVLPGVYREQRALLQGDGGQADGFRFMFTFRTA